MAVTARSNRKVAPKAATPAEVPATNPKPSIWTRVKTVTTKTAKVVRNSAVIVGKTIAKPFKAVAKKIKPAAKTTFVRGGKVYTGTKARIVRIASNLQNSVKRIATKVAPRVSRFWTLSLRPMLAAMLIAFAFTGLLVAAVFAPFVTALVLLGGALGVFGMAMGLKRLELREAAGSRAAHVILNIIEGVAQFLRAFMYAVTAVAVFAMCLVSLPFALFVAVDLVLSYFEVRGATTIAFLVSCLASGNWAMALAWLMWRGMRGGVITERSVPAYSEIRRSSDTHADTRHAKKDVTPAMAPNNPETWTRGNYLHATGTEELWGTEFDAPPPSVVVHDDADEGRSVPVQRWDVAVTNEIKCSSCNTDKGAMRLRSHSFVQLHTREAVAVGDSLAKMLEWTPVAGAPFERSTEMLCSACYVAECEDLAITYTGVSLDKVSVEVRLNKTGIEHSPEHAKSVFEPESFVWLVSGWWRDKAGTQHAREHSCLVNGKVVATVVKDHRRNVFRATVLGKLVDSGVTKTLETAKYAAQSDLNDELNAVDRHVEAAEATAASPRRQAKKS